MSMSARRVRAIFRKELREYRRNRQIVVSMAILPLLFLIQPLIDILALPASAAGTVNHEDPQAGTQAPDPTPQPCQSWGSRAGSTTHTLPADQGPGCHRDHAGRGDESVRARALITCEVRRDQRDDRRHDQRGPGALED